MEADYVNGVEEFHKVGNFKLAESGEGVHVKDVEEG